MTNQPAPSDTPGKLVVRGPHQCNRSLNDPKDIHYSVFDEYGGNVAHFWKREDAERYATMEVEIARLSTERENVLEMLNDSDLGKLLIEVAQLRAKLAEYQAKLGDALQQLVRLKEESLETCNESIRRGVQIISLEEQLAASERQRKEMDGKLEWLWANCKIVHWTKNPMEYPIEHNPMARKYQRMEIESEMAKSLRSPETPSPDAQ